MNVLSQDAGGVNPKSVEQKVAIPNMNDSSKAAPLAWSILLSPLQPALRIMAVVWLKGWPG